MRSMSRLFARGATGTGVLLILVGLALVAIAAAFAGWRWLGVQVDRPGPAATALRVQVAAGSRLRGVLAHLQRQGALRHALAVEVFLRLQGRLPRIQAGLYEITPHESARQIVTQLAEGRVLLSSITIVEGWRFADMRAALDADPDVQHDSHGLAAAQLMQRLGHAGEPPEGRFFPDTYRFASGSSDWRILQMAYERMQATLQADWAQRAGDLPLATPAQALTLASIIEKETARVDERPKIAAVFVNRLRMGMRLQSDPTVIYGLGERYDGSIHTHDLTSDTPYNTYTRAGLPPTPIALPGAAALQAAMHPAQIDALYFVASGLPDGSHHFSATLGEHDIAVRDYLRRLGVAVQKP
ncbi:MAG TPA: endolytic transglycosylase MltG [Steroidobacteraceae bacterium]|jgi:UPF0755 protein|nr:endolytic transglycosylase MltG [Steroidobacteraceae bacterium]